LKRGCEHDGEISVMTALAKLCQNVLAAVMSIVVVVVVILSMLLDFYLSLCINERSITYPHSARMLFCVIRNLFRTVGHDDSG
jgi:hypothetical protein